MKIGFIGVGKIGGCLARELKGAGHGPLLANSRAPDSLAHGSRPKGSPERFGADDRAKLPERRDLALQEMMRLPNFPSGLVTRDTVPLLRALAGI